MPRQPRLEIRGHPMHVDQRGVNRCAFFLDDADRLNMAQKDLNRPADLRPGGRPRLARDSEGQLPPSPFLITSVPILG
jgi:hypothetical protein